MERGYIKLYRAVMDHQIWHHKPFSYGQAWAHMLMLANHKEGTIWVNKSPIKVARGQLGWSQDKLKSEFGWSRQQVRTFLNHLKNDQMINQVNHGRISIISITNYEKYHESNQMSNHPVTSSQPSDNQVITTNKKDKNKKNEKNKEKDPLVKASFETFWKLYPARKGKKVGKQVAFEQFAKINPSEWPLLKRAVKSYAVEMQDGFAKDAERFLKKDYWRDWISETAEPETDAIRAHSEAAQRQREEDARNAASPEEIREIKAAMEKEAMGR